MDTCAALEKLYPQMVDRRIIRATAIEHKNDLQAGIDFIEGEVLDWKARRSIESTQILDYREFSEAPAMDSTDTDIVDTDNVDENAELVSSDDPGVWKSASSSMYAVDCETIEQMIEQTKTDKQNLMVSIQEMKELRRVAEQAEAAARSAKAQALEGVEALHASAEEVRKTVAEAREANAVHSGEVYGEKAVLGTEARELFSRVQQVRTEWLKASDILEEMKATLQDRIAKAKEDERVADEERLRKEAASRELLQKEEDILAQITQESIELDLEADNCTKLREFLMKQGTVVDSLQRDFHPPRRRGTLEEESGRPRPRQLPQRKPSGQYLQLAAGAHQRSSSAGQRRRIRSSSVHLILQPREEHDFERRKLAVSRDRAVISLLLPGSYLMILEEDCLTVSRVLADCGRCSSLSPFAIGGFRFIFDGVRKGYFLGDPSCNKDASRSKRVLHDTTVECISPAYFLSFIMDCGNSTTLS
ncbi:hypothetical protein SELMODRAFT_406194 [Selaginella moellendorffii]|uniref:CUE domain-containing protein n=1 Tax=Selaginella moellendorffii TaxID=88036 RepID=D8R1K7_SELML|nr:hypothetical protein SELMODRAFT_406194 [Selaginella moellendorffii]